MRKLSKIVCSLGLTAAVFAGTILSGCADSINYTEEIKRYQERLEELEAENAQMREQLEQLGVVVENEPDEETVAEEDQTVSENQIGSEGEPAEAENEVQPEEEADGLTRILVLGDSIWGNYRDDTGIAAKVENYMASVGRPAKVYNAAIGGTRATIAPDDNEWQFGPSSENSLAKMVSILNEETDVEYLQGKAAYDDMKAALDVRSSINVVIIAYGMNDFLSQAPENNSDRPWTGYGTALAGGVEAVRRACPDAEILIVAPSYASYFPIPVQNMGPLALYNYASVACDKAKEMQTLCVDAYNNLGIDPYTAEDYLEDGIHLNERGRDIYAKAIVSCLIAGTKGEVSGNNLIDFDNYQQ